MEASSPAATNALVVTLIDDAPLPESHDVMDREQELRHSVRDQRNSPAKAMACVRQAASMPFLG
jgi:hypothetical protein